MTTTDASAALAALEAAFARARDAFGMLYVARATRRAAAIGPDWLEALEAADCTERAILDDALERAAPLLDRAALDDEDRRAWQNLRTTLAWMDEVAGLEPNLGGPGEVAGTGDPGNTAGGSAARPGGLRAATLADYAAAAAAVVVGEERLDRGTVLGRLATEPNPAQRRRLFESLAPVWRAMDGDGTAPSPYRRLLRDGAAAWERDGSPIEAAAVGSGFAPGTLEPMLRELLAAWRAVVQPEPVEPWDYRFTVGAAARRLRDRVPLGRLRTINDAHLASLGADPARLGITYDVEPWGGRPPVPVAFTLSPRLPVPGAGGSRSDGSDPARPTPDGGARPWVVAAYAEGGLGNLAELLHESGHAIHDAAIRSRPLLFDLGAETGGFVEAIADMVGWDAHEPAFQARHLGASAPLREARLGRYGEVMLDVCWTLFEIELHRAPSRSPNEVWSELTETGLGIRPHPEWSWWAVRGQLLEAPGYMANYALAAIAAAAIRARIREVRGDWLAGDPGWYAFVSERLLRWGAARPPAEVLGEFLGGPLTATALLDDLAGLAAEA